MTIKQMIKFLESKGYLVIKKIDVALLVDKEIQKRIKKIRNGQI